MKFQDAHSKMGCLVINDLISGGERFSGLSSFLRHERIDVASFACQPEDDLHMQLQTAFRNVREHADVACIIAVGTGCHAALALASQLPVERIVLIDDGSTHRESVSSSRRRQVSRLAGFARRNQSFCVSDVLLIAMEENSHRRLENVRKSLYHGRVHFIDASGSIQHDLWTNCKDPLKKAIYCFLNTGDLPKSLAQNSEMCIMYE